MQKEGGRATELAVKQFAAQLYRTQGMEYRVKQDIRITENELNFLLGRYKGAIIRNRPSSPPTASVAAGIPAQMLSNRADILQAEAELKATKAEIAAAKAAFFPSVSITAMAGFNSYDASLLFDPKSFAFNILGGIAAPLFNRNTVKANHKLSLAENKGAFYQFCKTVMNAYHEVNTALTNMDNLEKQHQLNKQEADALNESVKIANDLYIAGYANYLEVITAQKNALEAELNVVHTRQKQQYNNINLYRALGGGWRK